MREAVESPSVQVYWLLALIRADRLQRRRREARDKEAQHVSTPAERQRLRQQVRRARQLTAEPGIFCKRATTIGRPRHKHAVKLCGTNYPTRTNTKSRAPRLLLHVWKEYIGRFYTTLDCRSFEFNQESFMTYFSMDGFTFGKQEPKRMEPEKENEVWREHIKWHKHIRRCNKMGQKKANC